MLNKTRVILFLLVTMILALMPSALAAHDTDISITPDLANCEELSKQYTVSITHLNGVSGNDDIREVRIYDDVDNDGIRDDGIVNFECGAAPTGWELDDRLASFNYCQYETSVQNSCADCIKPNETLVFTFNATLDDANLLCGNEFKIATIDDRIPVGEVVFKFPEVSVDCTDPILEKSVGDPKILIDPQCDPEITTCDYWITFDTDIDVSASDTNETDTCNLGLDFCRWRVTLDGVQGQWNVEENGDTLDWTINYKEDSNHFLEIECVDEAGNIVYLNETERVDDTPPTTTKNFTGPQKLEQTEDGLVEWIDGVSVVNLFANDPDPTGFSCNIGVDKTWYRIDLDEDAICWEPNELCNDRNVGLPTPYDQDPTCIEDAQEFCDESFSRNSTAWFDCVEDEIDDWCDISSGWNLWRGNPIGDINESCHVMQYFSVDHLGNVEDTQFNCFFVDKTAPSLSKYMGDGPRAGQCPPRPGTNDTCYITSDTEVVLGCTDRGPHPSGDEIIWYRYRFTEDGLNWSEWLPGDQCPDNRPFLPDGWCDSIAGESKVLKFPESSMHELQWYCEDAVEKRSETDIEVFRVDNDPPIINKTMLGVNHLGQCPPRPGTNDTCYVADNRENGVSVWVEDTPSIHASNDVVCEYSVVWHTSESECRNAGGEIIGPNNVEELCLIDSGEFSDHVEIIFTEDSTHDLHIYCEDAVGNSVEDWETFLVDSTPPETVKEYGEPFFSCYDWCWLECYGPDSQNPGESCVEACVENRSMCGGYDNQGHLYPQWITSNTKVNLTSTDEKVGVDELSYRVTLVPDEYCEDAYLCMACDYDMSEYQESIEGWEPLNCTDVTTVQSNVASFMIPEESCHLIEYAAVDLLGNEELLNWQCTFVDNTPPLMNVSVGDPKKPGADAGLNVTWVVTQETPVEIVCRDQDPHPVGHTSACFKVRLEGQDVTETYCDPEDLEGGFCCFAGESFEFFFEEDSFHELDLVCEDALGNMNEPATFTFAVETVPPVTTKTYLDPFYEVEVCGVEGIAQNETICVIQEFIDTASRIQLDAVDPEPHPSGLMSTFYRVSLVPDLYCENQPDYCMPCEYTNNECDDFTEYNNTPFGIPEESCHVVEFYSVDMLGNEEDLQWQCVFVDKTPPVIQKLYDGPYYNNSEGHEFVNLDTEVLLSIVDPAPHPSGVNYADYRITLMDNDEPCWDREVCQESEGNGDWTPVEGATVTFPQESCHLLEVRAGDNVNKTSLHKQCVFVDATPPTPNKTVGEPKEPMSDENIALGELFFPGMNETCQNPNGCWDITLMTPLELECVDPEPHPSGATDICFQVFVDGDDVTEEYCGEDLYDGNFNQNGDGYCCLEGGVDNFMFNEETWHKLNYYCEDNVGNSGNESVDMEFFKVEGAPFNIYLYKKWNLISVPFVLLDNSPETIFGDLEHVDTVWTYDSINDEWLVWSPEGPNSLTSVMPGWGYWVLMAEDENMTIGGSLLQPAVLPPFRSLTPGWNLIGPYGTQWQEYNMLRPEDKNFMCEDEGGFKEDVFGSDVYCQLNSLIDTQQGFPRWSALWSYVNCGNHEAGWFGLNACVENLDDRMYAGRGYWIELDVNDIFAPATTCVWNDDNVCIGGLID